MAHQTVSWWDPYPGNSLLLYPILTKDFESTPGTGICLPGGLTASNHLPTCITKLVVHFKPKTCIAVVGRAKSFI